MLFNALKIDGTATLHAKVLPSLCNGEELVCLRTVSGIFYKNFIFFFNNNKSFWVILWLKSTETCKNYHVCDDIYQNFRNDQPRQILKPHFSNLLL